ncbi:MAG: Methionyl-tRNA formyltransferase [Parcubacteria group bacterium GW2011_GWF2_52_12]|uniref:Methionyl-tRNA formyltransferase n=1 Tax=Candidatus Vogelbacteria bacterium RIFOXYD1_FULL_51_18 TaxID=1802440 RepID=A0A1G2QID9_9BACT|nr:MAG: Methionyl-tRNA formyltransferase [Parcubacteria group bacterium GW2011_GWC1_51_35]KKW24619.1 MAG: Methionyl-tRNA formyltransferase [Parcubacteria group bacterium GW2011_GWF2_52_12]KKW26115.1 MAG: Methionyl-tRNA formyltransferase [Parcubacteria group bacterium GW2011_GWF1_52_5]KKW34988.1 MAG: Methionyl-tRNA formyltransferase [Parcubacteria group bacterium GW2011_GWB1_53_43]KKW38610.1 MAG: Methionyl-tRNA formyltransferase [Parcubacteria group bacterium GW2011_GWA1_54_88]OHA60404.1 MAG: m
MINYAFWGSDDFSILVLEELVQAGYPSSLIVTMPDRPAGRAHKLTPPPLKEWALAHGVPFIQPENLADTECREFQTLGVCLFIVASYGKIIPEAVFNIPERGAVNIHPSLLPRYRGATPIEGAILGGAPLTGVTVMRIDAKMDHGAIIAQKEVPLRGDEWYPELAEKLAHEGGKLLASVLPAVADGTAQETPQDEIKATYTKMIKKEDGFVNLADDSELNFRKIRAYEPWPRTFFTITHKGKKSRVVIIAAHREGRGLSIDRVIPEGGREMSYQDFLRGYGDLSIMRGKIS